MRVITRKRLNEFIIRFPDSKASLKFWYDTITDRSYFTAQAVIDTFRSADYVGNNRIVFNIARNKYRLIVKFAFHEKAQVAYVRFIGTHNEYDSIIDIENI